MGREKVYKILFHLLFSLILTVNSYGQSSSMEFDHYTTNDGLSNGYINSILQDSRGFMWFGTNNGLNRFDGITFKTYFFDPQDTNSISSRAANYLVEDSLSRIWVMTNEGVCVYDPKLDRFSRKQFIIKGNKIAPPNSISGFIDSKGFLWIGSFSGIFRIKIYNNPSISASKIDAEMFLLDEPDIKKINVSVVNSFVEDEDGKIWATSFSNQLFYFDPQLNKFIPEPIRHPEAIDFSNKGKKC